MSKETLKANLREIPDFPIPGILFYDVTTLFKNPECLQEMLDSLYEMYKDKGIIKVVEVPSAQGTNSIVVCSHIRTIRPFHPHGNSAATKFTTSDICLGIVPRAVAYISLIPPGKFAARCTIPGEIKRLFRRASKSH